MIFIIIFNSKIKFSKSYKDKLIFYQILQIKQSFKKFDIDKLLTIRTLEYTFYDFFKSFYYELMANK